MDKAAVRDGGEGDGQRLRSGTEARRWAETASGAEGERLGSFGSNEIERGFRVFDHMF